MVQECVQNAYRFYYIFATTVQIRVCIYNWHCLYYVSGVFGFAALTPINIGVLLT